MITGKKKYYGTLLASMVGIGSLGLAYAQTITDAASGNMGYTSAKGGDSQSTNTQAYDLLTEAQTKAKTADEDADKTHTESKDDFLKRIADNTYAFLKAFNNYSLNWLQIYSTPTSNELDSYFGKYMESSQNNYKDQLALLNSREGSLYGVNDPSRYIFASQMAQPDTNYATMVKQNGKNPKTGEPDPVSDEIKKYARYFVKNASGINMPHKSPSEFSAGKDEFALRKYITFYNTTSAVASYNAYVLNDHLADLQKNFRLSQVQMDLKNYASDMNWLTHVNEEQSIGVILRQLLLFTSQMYVVSLQSLETEKQLLAAIAMQNSLIMLTNGQYEDRLLDDAKKR